MNTRKSGYGLACVLFLMSAFAWAAADGGSDFPGKCELGECYSNLDPATQQSRLNDRLHAVTDPASGLKHFYQYITVPSTPENVMGIFLNFSTHAFGSITKVEVKKEPSGSDFTFEVYYELKVAGVTSKYIVQHQVFRDAEGGFGSMWRLSPLSEGVKSGFLNLSKPEEVKGYIHVSPKDGGSAVTYYSYQKAKVSKLGFGVGTANNIAEKQLKETVDGFMKLWSNSTAPLKCITILKNAPILAGNP